MPSEWSGDCSGTSAEVELATLLQAGGDGQLRTCRNAQLLGRAASDLVAGRVHRPVGLAIGVAADGTANVVPVNLKVTCGEQCIAVLVGGQTTRVVVCCLHDPVRSRPGVPARHGHHHSGKSTHNGQTSLHAHTSCCLGFFSSITAGGAEGISTEKSPFQHSVYTDRSGGSATEAKATHSGTLWTTTCAATATAGTLSSSVHAWVLAGARRDEARSYALEV
ncbi:hypothetical protein SFR_7013 (plasmid) [Streptomyces sp. FR-008]|nr:hypothetical protein SFR_7013 [Streptomyces sp. FR-008]